MLASRKQRIAALEQVSRRLQKRHVAVFSLCLTQPITPAQQAALAAAKAAGRPVLVIRGSLPELPPEYGQVVVVDDVDNLGSSRPDMTPLARPGWFDR